jgi:hypothetical protein
MTLTLVRTWESLARLKLASDSWPWARNWGKTIATRGPSGERHFAVVIQKLTDSNNGTRRIYSEEGYLSHCEQKIRVK